MGWRIESAGPEAERVVSALLEQAVGGGWAGPSLVATLGGAGAAHLQALDDAGGLVGLVLARRVLDAIEVDQVVVRRAVRRRGVGRALLQTLIARARAEEVRRLHLELARSNVAARALYEEVGFVVVGERPRYYPDGDDALLMTCDLPSGDVPGKLRTAETRGVVADERRRTE